MLLQSIDYQIVTRWLFCGFLKMEKSNNSGAPDKPCGRAVQMLTQKHVAKRYIISQKVVPLHHETERRYKYV